ncbi:hypothetical protein [Burkholderia multivorans]|uniref:hypothetical protein n=1 Tax=Burkholderia multivorans TaxID=87883 RepID=UPI00286FB277|nr:hypothetical protein [Burkholderia multivorans]
MDRDFFQSDHIACFTLTVNVGACLADFLLRRLGELLIVQLQHVAKQLVGIPVDDPVTYPAAIRGSAGIH